MAAFSRVLAGPYAILLLADLDADVVKVEGPHGDNTRTWSPPLRDGVSTYDLGVIRNKRSVALDLNDADDRADAQELARHADIVLENFKPGGLARFGLDYDTVAAGNPGVVYASISGFGSGPGGAALPGYDLIVQAISGLMSLTGPPTGGRTAPASPSSTSSPDSTPRSACWLHLPCGARRAANSAWRSTFSPARSRGW